jgi:hypothetical protein
MHSIETLLNQWLANATLPFGMVLSTKSVGNSSIRHMTAQEMCAGCASLTHQGLSVHMPALGTLLSTKSVHTSSLAWNETMRREPFELPVSPCLKMTLGNFIVMDQ